MERDIAKAAVATPALSVVTRRSNLVSDVPPTRPYSSTVTPATGAASARMRTLVKVPGAPQGTVPADAAHVQVGQTRAARDAEPTRGHATGLPRTR